MKRTILESITVATAALVGCSPYSLAQPAPPISPATRTVVAPVAPPATVISKVAPSTFVVTPVPGLAAATKVKIQKFSDYDLNKDGAYNAMEFGQALYFLATSDPVLGNPKLPRQDRFLHKGAPQKINPKLGTALLNATSEEFVQTDTNRDWKITPEELAAVALM